MRWLTSNGGSDLHSDPPRFRILTSGFGCVAVDDATGEQTSLLDEIEEARLWCENRLENPYLQE